MVAKNPGRQQPVTKGGIVLELYLCDLIAVLTFSFQSHRLSGQRFDVSNRRAKAKASLLSVWICLHVNCSETWPGEIISFAPQMLFQMLQLLIDHYAADSALALVLENDSWSFPSQLLDFYAFLRIGY